MVSLFPSTLIAGTFSFIAILIALFFFPEIGSHVSQADFKLLCSGGRP